MTIDVCHGKETPLVEVTVEFLDSYLKSIGYSKKYSLEEIIKGNMPPREIAHVQERATLCSVYFGLICWLATPPYRLTARCRQPKVQLQQVCR